MEGWRDGRGWMEVGREGGWIKGGEGGGENADGAGFRVGRDGAGWRRDWGLGMEARMEGRAGE